MIFYFAENLSSCDILFIFCKCDSHQQIQLAQKPKGEHMELPLISSMRVNLAALVLSHPGAGGISALVYLEHLPGECMNTAKLLNTLISFLMYSTATHSKGLQNGACI